MLRIEGLSHAYQDIVSLRDVSLQVDAGEILCLLGPSGCGKTTLLRVIAGLEAEYRGAISFAGAKIDKLPAHQRGFGLMFQDYALFPHMSVADNIAYGLKRRGYDKKERRQIVEGLLRQVGLAGYDGRDVASLSGGQKQRVALARSLAPNPRLLMLDEPLGSLDAQLRDQLALELRQIIKQQGLSAIYVTHDHREAYAVADRIAVMNVGSVQQHDTAQNIYHKPKNAFVARFLGMRNIFPLDHNTVTKRLAHEAQGFGAAKIILIHPGGIHLETAPNEPSLQFEAILERVVFRGDRYDVSVSIGEEMSLTFASVELSAAIGEAVTLHIALDAVKALAN